MALKLMYHLFANLLSWMVLRARSDAAKEIEILVPASSTRRSAAPPTAATDQLDRPRRDRRPRPTTARFVAAADCWSHPRPSCAGTDTSSAAAGPPRTPAPADQP